MIEIKSGDRIKLPDGTIVKVLGYYNQGKHRIFKLEGGGTVMDLHKDPNLEVVPLSKDKEKVAEILGAEIKPKPKPKPSRPMLVDPYDLSVNGDDLSSPNMNDED